MTASAWDDLVGYRRPDGRFGVRNRIVVMAAADNVNPLARAISAAVPGTTFVPATFGRGQLGTDLDVTLRAQSGLAAHPNVADTLIVSFEMESAERIAELVRALGRSPTCLSLLAEGGHSRALSVGTRVVSAMIREAAALPPEPMPVSSLVIGLECGGSDATSGLVANPVVGRMSDALVAAGATTVFSEPVELIGCEPMLAKRAVTPAVAAQIRRLTSHYAHIADSAGVNLVGINPTADNIAGGLTSIEEKSLGAVVKCGTAPIVGVLEYGELAPQPGLWLMDAPAAAVENLTALAAGGCHAILFTSGSVNPSGHAVSPTLKICANPKSTATMGEHIDVDLSGVLDGRVGLDGAETLVSNELLGVLGGRETKAHQLGYVETRISRVGLSV